MPSLCAPDGPPIPARAPTAASAELRGWERGPGAGPPLLSALPRPPHPSRPEPRPWTLARAELPSHNLARSCLAAPAVSRAESSRGGRAGGPCWGVGRRVGAPGDSWTRRAAPPVPKTLWLCTDCGTAQVLPSLSPLGAEGLSEGANPEPQPIQPQAGVRGPPLQLSFNSLLAFRQIQITPAFLSLARVSGPRSLLPGNSKDDYITFP